MAKSSKKDPRRTHSIRIPVNKQEFDTINQRAKAAGWKTASYLRWMGLCLDMPDAIKMKS